MVRGKDAYLYFMDSWYCEFTPVFFCVFLSVMKLRPKPYFTELAAHLLKRTMDEGRPDLVLKWGESIFQCLPRYAFILYILKYLKEIICNLTDIQLSVSR